MPGDRDGGAAAGDYAATARSPGIFYLLQSADGRFLAGNMLPVEPSRATFAAPGSHQPPERISPVAYAVAVVLPDGSYLFVGVSDYQLGEAREVIVRARVLGLAAAVVWRSPAVSR